MITVEKARKLILKNTEVLPSLKTDILNALGCILSENVSSPINLPSFNQSAMDGFAIKISDYIQNNKIRIIGEVAAGKVFQKTMNSGQAVRIFTGAPLPDGADTVVMQEKTSIENGYLIINDLTLQLSANVRKAGSQINKGRTALPKASIVTPGSIGYLSAMGVSSVNIISTPRITIIVTGNELKKRGTPLKKGQIYESNSYTLVAALQSIYLKSYRTVLVQDNELKIFNAIEKAVADSDMVLITGGVSVGDYDFTGKSLKKLGVKNVFYKVKQKPGKPLFFGRYKKTLVYGLPGNPAAVLSCFYEYVLPSIRVMQGRKDPFLKKTILPITKDYSKKKGLSFFLKGKISGSTVTPLDGQESYILSSFAVADAIIYLPEEVENIKSGNLVEVHLLPSL